MTTIYICNKSSLVTNKDVKRMVAAVNHQVITDYKAAWERTAKVVFTSREDLDNTVFLFDDPDVAGALGYHDETPTGKPYGRVFARINGQVQDFFGPKGISVTLSHEVLELLGNPCVNRWRDMPDGKRQTCEELCDAVEGDAYPIAVNGNAVDPTYVSNFLWPAWFDDQAPAGTQCDQLDKTPGPFQFSTASPGENYMIVRNIGTGEKQVFGADGNVKELPEHKKHPAARSQRILAA
jgi:hypothetical protein